MVLTLTLYKLFSTGIASMLEMVAFSGKMLDAGYLMLDIQELTNGEIQKQPVSRNQYPGSVNTGNGFRRNGLYRV
jgi:hypothetical protein